MTGPVDIEEGRRLHEFARMADAFPQRVTTGADLGVWSRNNLPALLDEAEKVPTLEAEVERLRAENEELKRPPADKNLSLPEMLVVQTAEIARLRAENEQRQSDVQRVREAFARLEHQGKDDFARAVDALMARDAEIARLREALKEIIRGEEEGLVGQSKPSAIAYAALAPVVEEPK